MKERNEYKNRVFTFYGNNPAPILPSSSYALRFNLNNYNRLFKVKSLFFDIFYFDSVTQERVSNFQHAALDVGFDSLKSIGEAFQDFSAGFQAKTGRGFMIIAPQQVLFDSFFVSGQLDFALSIYNYDTLKSIGFQVSITCEIETI